MIANAYIFNCVENDVKAVRNKGDCFEKTIRIFSEFIVVGCIEENLFENGFIRRRQPFVMELVHRHRCPSSSIPKQCRRCVAKE